LVGAEVAGDAIGEVVAGSPAVVPGSLQAASPKSAPAIGTMSNSFLIIGNLTSGLSSGKVVDGQLLSVNADIRAQFRDSRATISGA
jgi:hypothetical protein